MQFVPSHLRVERGSAVTWQVCAEKSMQSSLYVSNSRSHIISFDEIYVESPKLDLATLDTFSMTFEEVGTFSYGCCIFSRMRGSIEVVEFVPPRMMMSYQYPW